MTEQLQFQTEVHMSQPEDIRALGSLSMAGEVRASDVLANASEAANYQGNWMLAQQDRMSTPDFKAKYASLVEGSMSNLKEGAPGIFDKPEQFQSYHQDLADTYTDRTELVYSAVGYAPAEKFGLSPHQTGRGNIGARGTVFSDATIKDGTPLTDKQKDIIAAHEAYHGVIKAPEPVKTEIAKAFDSDVYYEEIVDGEGLKQPEYLKKPDELMARMAQLKNYFGMQGAEEFTKGHLDYARTHYVEDTGLDNSMSVMLRIVTPRTETDFLRLMNTLPV